MVGDDRDNEQPGSHGASTARQTLQMPGAFSHARRTERFSTLVGRLQRVKCPAMRHKNATRVSSTGLD